ARRQGSRGRAELPRGGLSAARANGPRRLGEPVCQVTLWQVTWRPVSGPERAQLARGLCYAWPCDRPAQPAACFSSHALPRVELSRRRGERHIPCRRSAPHAADPCRDTVVRCHTPCRGHRSISTRLPWKPIAPPLSCP